MEFVLKYRPMTREQYVERTGHEPHHDDLDRVNCPHAGAIGHLCCGWNDRMNRPQFMIGPQAWNGKPAPTAGQE